ncbi:hypothetical protein [Pedosphaera parvula]|uniref:Uncharacterized protein n=1 Tax=Pedosphaera parvula (strain Ellin514) TaxID=320771 RepID=B9XQJ4_PEDPL|nr:hypothetical protein [Pedosphaera parvula]EEF57919.1 hypothetical protein Cflav_PD0869 [Pedosphaera parvula Ellin514]
MSLFCKQSRFGGCILFAVFALFAPNALSAQQDLTALRPPKGELAPGFWEQFGWVVAAGLIVLFGVALTWAMLRKGKKPPILPAPAMMAKRELEALRGQTKGEAHAFGVSKIIKNYLVLVLCLPPGEYTTLDINKALQTQPDLGEDLKQNFARFLRECDEQKFSGAHSRSDNDIITSASGLIDQTESQLKQIRSQTAPLTVSAPAK